MKAEDFSLEALGDLVGKTCCGFFLKKILAVSPPNGPQEFAGGQDRWIKGIDVISSSSSFIPIGEPLLQACEVPR